MLNSDQYMSPISTGQRNFLIHFELYIVDSLPCGSTKYDDPSYQIKLLGVDNEMGQR